MLYYPEEMERNAKSFIAEYSAPKIELPDTLKCTNLRQANLHKKIVSKLEEIKKQYDDLVDLHEWNLFVGTFECRMETIVGQTYYLYQNDDRRFLSIIAPEDFTMNYECLGATRVNSDGYFEKVWTK
jgi:hypothetical protein